MEGLIFGAILFIGGGILALLGFLWFLSWLFSGNESEQYDAYGNRETHFVSVQEEPVRSRQPSLSLGHILLAILFLWVSSDG